MSRYLIATIDVKLSGMGRFVETMGAMKAILTAAGWSLAGPTLYAPAWRGR